MLCREILLYEPYNYKSGTVQRGEAWRLIASSLNSYEDLKFTVTQRAVREKYNLLAEKYKKKERKEEQASGIAPPEMSDIERALEEIIERFREIESVSDKDKKKNEKNACERETAAELRQQCLETYSETQKRKGVAESDQGKSKRQRSMGGETITYLREKMEADNELRRREIELTQNRQETLQQLIVQQHQQNQALMQLFAHVIANKNSSDQN